MIGYRVELPSGASVEFVEPSVMQMIVALRSANKGTGARAMFGVNLALLRQVLRKVGDRALTGADLLGRWPLAVGDTNALVNALAGIVSATPEQADAAKAGTEVVTDGTGAVWTVLLPDGRRVAFRVLDVGAFQDALGGMDEEGTSALAGNYRVGLEGLRRSSLTVDGAPLTFGTDWLTAWPFSLRDTAILTDAWRSAHGLGDTVDPTVVPTA